MRALLVGLVAVPLALLLGGCPNPGGGGGGGNNPPPPGNSGITGAYVGSAVCKNCHTTKHNTWSATLHSEALTTLEGISQGTNSACLPCHTVGYGEAGGFVDRATTNDLAGVGCEVCHGPARAHVENIEDATKRPKVDIAAAICGKCHTDEHHPNYDDWLESKHSTIQPELVTEFAAGTNANSCGLCHSGDAFVMGQVKGETVPADLLKGKTAEQMNPIVCAACHDPHQRTGNAAAPEEGRDYQLRYPEIKYTTPTNTLAAAQDRTRFNICGQCHHARNRVWTDSSREPHPSDQVNVFFGEMPLPDAKPEPIIPSRPSVHLNAPEQCATCHVFRKPLVEGIAPAVSGHTFEVNFEGCVECHYTPEIAESKLAGLNVEINTRTAAVKAALDAWATGNDIEGKGVLSWEYTSEGGPTADGQKKIPDGIKKGRYIYYYVIAGGGTGAHNPDYVREGLVLALEYVETAGPRIP